MSHTYILVDIILLFLKSFERMVYLILSILFYFSLTEISPL